VAAAFGYVAMLKMTFPRMYRLRSIPADRIDARQPQFATSIDFAPPSFIETLCWKIFDAPLLIGATISLFFFRYLTLPVDYR
jgi:hypothetical protein